MNKTVAVLTPTYNRADTLGVLFESLKKQTSMDFKWYIINDGSLDNTEDICKDFCTEDFEIKYVLKDNGGKHTAVNMGLDIIEEELVFIVDSDDFLTEDAIETIVENWKPYRGRVDICGLSYYRVTPQGNVIGDEFRNATEFVDSYVNIMVNNKVAGDKAEVYRHDVFKEHKFPEFKREKFVSESISWFSISRDGYKLVFVPKGIYVCEYRGDGLTKAGKTKVVKNPLGYIEHAKTFLNRDIIQRLQWKYILMYIAAGFLSDRKICEIFKECPRKLKFICAFIPGYMLYWYWKKKWGK